MKSWFSSRWLFVCIGLLVGVLLVGSRASGISAQLSSTTTPPAPEITTTPTAPAWSPPSPTPTETTTPQAPGFTPPHGNGDGSGSGATMTKLHAIVERCAAHGGTPKQIADCVTGEIKSSTSGTGDNGVPTGSDNGKLRAAYYQCKAQLPNATPAQLKACVMQAVGTGSNP